jgi:hypothetical protein
MSMLPTYDYETDQADIQRRQKMLDALMAGGLAPLDTQRAPGVRVSPFEGVAKIVQAYMAGQGADKLKGERQH